MDFASNYVIQQSSLGNNGSFALGFDYGQIFIAYGTDPDGQQRSYVSGAYDGEAAATSNWKAPKWAENANSAVGVGSTLSIAHLRSEVNLKYAQRIRGKMRTPQLLSRANRAKK